MRSWTLPMLILSFAAIAGCTIPSAPTAGTPSPGSPASTPKGTPHLLIVAQVDGRSDLRISNGTVWWQHYDYDAPGRFNGEDHPTFVNGEAWYPEWPEDGPNVWCGGCRTRPLDLAAFGLSHGDESTQLFARAKLAHANVTCSDCRVAVRSASEGGVLTIHVDDSAPPGWDWYVFDVEVGSPAR